MSLMFVALNEMLETLTSIGWIAMKLGTGIHVVPQDSVVILEISLGLETAFKTTL